MISEKCQFHLYDLNENLSSSKKNKNNPKPGLLFTIF